jgi:hypothetical protein
MMKYRFTMLTRKDTFTCFPNFDSNRRRQEVTTTSPTHTQTFIQNKHRTLFHSLHQPKFGFASLFVIVNSCSTANLQESWASTGFSAVISAVPAGWCVPLHSDETAQDKT